jgi:UDP-N-acetylmuramate--alanine ligase
MKLPTDIGPIHFIGIGGIGMSGIAEVLMNLGYSVQGSDATDSANVKRLRDKGATVSVGHSAQALGDAAVVSGLDCDQARQPGGSSRRVPSACRWCGAPRCLAELMRLRSCVAIAGTHGKTTTAARRRAG